MHLSSYETSGDIVRAGYSCPCGCTPSVTHQRGGELATSQCCCGNEFVVGPDADQALSAREGFTLESEQRTAAWGESVTAAWLLGPSTHPVPEGGHDHAHEHGHHHDDDGDGSAAVDPVCGMSVDPAAAAEKGLHRQHKGVDYYFCGKGCFLDFGDDPEHYLDSAYAPSM